MSRPSLGRKSGTWFAEPGSRGQAVAPVESREPGSQNQVPRVRPSLRSKGRNLVRRTRFPDQTVAPVESQDPGSQNQVPGSGRPSRHGDRPREPRAPDVEAKAPGALDEDGRRLVTPSGRARARKLPR